MIDDTFTDLRSGLDTELLSIDEDIRECWESGREHLFRDLPTTEEE